MQDWSTLLYTVLIFLPSFCFSSKDGRVSFRKKDGRAVIGCIGFGNALSLVNKSFAPMQMSEFVPIKRLQGREISAIASKICPFASVKMMEFGVKILTVHKILIHLYLTKVYSKSTLTYF